MTTARHFERNHREGTAVLEYDLDEPARQVNKRRCNLTRAGATDSMKLDDAGSVWTADGDDIYVRGPQGKVSVVFNARPLKVNASLAASRPY